MCTYMKLIAKIVKNIYYGFLVRCNLNYFIQGKSMHLEMEMCRIIVMITDY